MSDFTKFIAGVVGAIMFVLVIAWAINWFSTPLRLSEPQRLERISREANLAHEALEAERTNINGVRSKILTMKSLYGEDMSAWPQGKDDEYLQLQAQLINLVTSYNNHCAEYRAKWQDEWWEFSAPKDLPTTCEMLSAS